MAIKVINNEEEYTYDDVLLVPQYSDLNSRAEADTSVNVCGQLFKTPLLSANMDTVTGPDLAIEMSKMGGAGVLHRYEDPKVIIEWIKRIKKEEQFAIASIGVQSEDFEIAKQYVSAGVDWLCIDIAHGHSKAMKEMISKIVTWQKQYFGKNMIKIIAGNVCTPEAVKDLKDWGADIVKIGIGPGSNCTTRLVTGHGFPQLSAIANCSKLGIPTIADGGLKTSGDIVKALAAGADLIMSGSLFAGCDEIPQLIGFQKDIKSEVVYRGMASKEAQLDFRGKINNNAPEGESRTIKRKGPVKNIVEQLNGGIRSGMSYSGAKTIEELQTKARFVKVSSNVLIENHVQKT